MFIRTERYAGKESRLKIINLKITIMTKRQNDPVSRVERELTHGHVIFCGKDNALCIYPGESILECSLTEYNDHFEILFGNPHELEMVEKMKCHTIFLHDGLKTIKAEGYPLLNGGYKFTGSYFFSTMEEKLVTHWNCIRINKVQNSGVV